MARSNAGTWLGILTVTGLLAAGEAWGGATTYAVSGEFDFGGIHTAKQWIDDEGVLHLREITYLLTSKPAIGNIDLQLSGICNHNYDLVGGSGNYWGKDTIIVTWNGLTGVFRGSHSGTRVAHTTGYASHVYHGIGGDLSGWQLRLEAVWDFGGKDGTFEGILKDPHGG
jgi:hypothetical protein